MGKRSEIKVSMGIRYRVLEHGERSMLTEMRYEKGDRVPVHSHMNEQIGYVLNGKVSLLLYDRETILEVGGSYTIPSGVEHSLHALEDSLVLDYFTPVREEYLL